MEKKNQQLKYYNQLFINSGKSLMIGWCLTPTLAIFQLYRGVNSLQIYILLLI
jgi:hypothetical protein